MPSPPLIDDSGDGELPINGINYCIAFTLWMFEKWLLEFLN